MWATLRRKLPAHLGDAVVGIGVALLGVQLLLFALRFWILPEGQGGFWADWLAVSWPNIAEGRVWTLLTYGLVHDLDSPLHLVFNLLGLYFLGPELERRWGTRGFLHLWIVAIAVGGLGTVLAQLVGLGLGPTVGASAGLMALLAAWSWLQPDARILLMFIFPVQARWILPLAVGLDLLLAFSGSDTAVAAHLGGVGGAWLVLHGWTRPRLVRTRYLAWKARRHRDKVKRSLTVIQGGRKGSDGSDDSEDDGPMIH